MKYLFIIYVNRSGSTFFTYQLSKLSEILVCPEAEVLVNLLMKTPDNLLPQVERDLLGSAMENDRKLKHWNLDIDMNCTGSKTRLELFFHILDHYRSTIKPNSQMIAFKAVDLINHVEKLHDFGVEKGLDILFISLIRDPRAIYNSQHQTFVEHRKNFMNRNPLATAYQWNHLVTRSIEYVSRYKMLILKYEDLLNQFKKEMDRILKFAGFMDEKDFDELEGDLKARIPQDQLPMHLHFTNPPMPAKADQWRTECNVFTLELIQQFTKEGLERMNYPILRAKQPGIIKLLIVVWYKVEIALKDCYRFLWKTPFVL